jgi:hypothetical protein
MPTGTNVATAVTAHAARLHLNLDMEGLLSRSWYPGIRTAVRERFGKFTPAEAWDFGHGHAALVNVS